MSAKRRVVTGFVVGAMLLSGIASVASAKPKDGRGDDDNKGSSAQPRGNPGGGGGGNAFSGGGGGGGGGGRNVREPSTNRGGGDTPRTFAPAPRDSGPKNSPNFSGGGNDGNKNTFRSGGGGVPGGATRGGDANRGGGSSTTLLKPPSGDDEKRGGSGRSGNRSGGNPGGNAGGGTTRNLGGGGGGDNTPKVRGPSGGGGVPGGSDFKRGDFDEKRGGTTSKPGGSGPKFGGDAPKVGGGAPKLGGEAPKFGGSGPKVGGGSGPKTGRPDLNDNKLGGANNKGTRPDFNDVKPGSGDKGDKNVDPRFGRTPGGRAGDDQPLNLGGGDKGRSTRDFDRDKSPGDVPRNAKIDAPKAKIPSMKIGKGGKLDDSELAKLRPSIGGGDRGPKDRGPGDKDGPRLEGGGKNIQHGRNRDRDVNVNNVINVVNKDRVNVIVNNKSAQKFNMAKQYDLRRDGDYARRMNFHRNVIGNDWRHNHYHGRINKSVYVGLHFGGWYAGPGFYPQWGWYPRWNPWVGWCWWDTVPYYWDPRPVIVRPVYYPVEVPIWTYYNVPVWRSMPVVASGTWVDVPPVVIDAGQRDLELLAVRFVDPGHPEQKQGPRYRAWYRNNGKDDVDGKFNVMAFASLDDKLAEDLPQAGVAVDGVAAGETQAVDIRLPFAANTMAKDEKGRSVPFKFLHLIVDSHNDLAETDKENNGAAIDRQEVLPVDPSLFSADVTQAAPGQSISIAGEGLGPEPGSVMLYVGGLELEMEVEGWFDLGVRAKVPQLPVADAVEAEVVVIRGDQAASNPIKLAINPDALAGLPDPER